MSIRTTIVIEPTRRWPGHVAIVRVGRLWSWEIWQVFFNRDRTAAEEDARQYVEAVRNGGVEDAPYVTKGLRRS